MLGRRPKAKSLEDDRTKVLGWRSRAKSPEDDKKKKVLKQRLRTKKLEDT